jgi:hypothetical protein
LANPDRLPIKTNTGGPQAQVQALIEAEAGLLEREVLLAPSEV